VGQQSRRFIRPIALIQAQPRSQARETHTVEAIKAALTASPFNVPAERIRIATGTMMILARKTCAARTARLNT